MKTKLIKLLGFTPVLVTPILGTSYIGMPHNITKKKHNEKTNFDDAAEYVSALAQTLKLELNSATLQTAISSAITKTNKVNITSYIAKAFAEAKIVVTAIHLNPALINDIKLSFKGVNNLQVQKISSSYILSVYPVFIGSKNNSSIITTLSLQMGTTSNEQKITNTYVVVKGFMNFSMVNGLFSNDIWGIRASADGDTIYAATLAGVAVGTKDGVSYTFKNYSFGLGCPYVYGISVPTKSNIIYVATSDGVAVGTKDGDSYTFKNYTAGLGSSNVHGIDVSADGNTIYAATADGVSVGTKTSKGYTFKNYTAGLGSSNVRGIDVSADGNTIYAATADGVSVGTKDGDSYTFKNYTAGLGSSNVRGIDVSADGNTIYAATADGVTVVTKDGDSKNYTAGLGSSNVLGIDVSADGNTIYAATADGVSVGTKDGDSYTFKNYTAGLGSSNVRGVYLSADGDAIYAATDGGISISKKVWNSPSSTFNNKIIMNLRKDL